MSDSGRPAARLAGSNAAADFAAIVALSPSGVVLTDATLPDNPVVYVNAAFEAMTGYSAHEIIGRNCRLLQGPGTDPAIVDAIGTSLEAGGEIEVEILSYRKDGQPFWNQLKIGPRLDDDGRVVGHIGIHNDVTARRALTIETELLQTRLTSIIDNIPGYVFRRILRRDGTLEIAYLSPFPVRDLGIPQGEPSTIEALWDCIHPEDRQPMRDGLARSAAELSPLTLEFRIRTADGEERWLRNYAKARRNEAGDVIWDGVGVDVTGEKYVEERLAYLAYHDPLTGLGNRMLFGVSLGRAMAAAETAGDRIVLMKLDLDSFKEVNETMGQQAGDAVLKEVARRLGEFAAARQGYAARMGGDEFAVFYPAPGDADDIDATSEVLAAELAVPIDGHGATVEIDASIGTAHFPFEHTGVVHSKQSELMRRAWVALLEAKLAGRGLRRSYSCDAVDRNSPLLMRQALRHAVESGQLRLHYQPLVDIATGAILGAEALLRWQHPSLGLLPPSQFIPLAETSGLMVAIGNWVAGEAMRQVRSWQEAGLNVPRISLNISALQLREPLFAEGLAQLLARHGVEASQFELELTEGLMIDASETTVALLTGLRDAGFGLSVDDFGAGHASFQYLRSFPLDRIKIDQTFIRHMVVDSSDASIIRAILQLGRRLELVVVAEGIETSEQRDFLHGEGCQIGQGYLYSMPLPPQDFAGLLRRAASLPAREKARKRPRAAALKAVPGSR